MNRNQVQAFSPSILLAISIVGLLLVPLMVMQTNLGNFEFIGQRDLVGVFFCVVCLFGVIAIFYPIKCKHVFQHTISPPAKTNSFSKSLDIKGHHPDCQNFLRNRITVNGRVFCAACSGLLVGTTITLISTMLYFFNDLNFAWGGIWLIVLGEILMLMGLAQIKAAGYVKAVLNALFVVGSFVTLASVDSAKNSLFLDLYVLGLILFLLWFRISLSEWNNTRICIRCQKCF